MKNTSCREGIKYWFELVGIIGGIIGVVVLTFQSCQMQRLNEATFASVKVSQQQMIVMQRQLDDSEAQQRAWLGIEDFQIRRIENSKTYPKIEGRYTVETTIVVKNFGSTPAADIGIGGEMLSEAAEQVAKSNGLSATMPQRWNKKVLPAPQPGHSGIGLMPLGSFTNIQEDTGYVPGENVYIEAWISYRDVFGHPWIIGEGGEYNFTNDSFSPGFKRWGQYQPQTN